MARKARPLWITLLGIAVVALVTLAGIDLPAPVRQLVKDVTGISLPAPDTGRSFKSVDVAGLPKTPKSFDTAKRLLYTQVHRDHAQSFYCQCPYDRKLKVALDRCHVQPRRNETRANRIEAEHVMPASHFGQHRECWRQEICTKSDGSRFKGRACCEAQDPVFRAAHNDLHNLQPAVGEINGDRRDYRWGMISGEEREYGRCDIEVDSSIRRAEPPEPVRGDIARTYFYMEDTYGFNLSDQQRQLFSAWDRQDPPDDWERERNDHIARLQGRGNRFIEEWSDQAAPRTGG